MNEIYINNKKIIWDKIYFDQRSMNNKKLSFLIRKKYRDLVDQSDIKNIEIIYQHGMGVRVSKDSDLYYYKCSGDIEVIDDMYQYYDHFELVLSGISEKIKLDAKAMNRQINIEEILNEENEI